MNPRHAGFMFRINMHWHHYCTMVVDGNPKAQPRSKGSARGGFVKIYDPGSAKPWKERIIYGTMQHKPQKPFEGPVRVDVKWMMPRPKSLTRKKDPEGEIPYTPKPDRDNLDKVVLDGMENCGWFRNDSLVTAGYIEKVYHAKDGIPGAEIKVWTWR